LRERLATFRLASDEPEATAYPEAKFFSISGAVEICTLIFFEFNAYTPISAKGCDRVHADGFARIRECGHLHRQAVPLIEPNMDNPFMARAIRLSLNNVLSGQGGPFGAVIVKNGSVIAEGVNRVTPDNDPTAHAEVVAIREACAKLGTFVLQDCEIYTSCEPCPMCLGAIYWAHVARVYFGNDAADASRIGFDDSFIYREFGQPFSERKIPMVQMMRNEALTAFKAWQEKPNKIPY
jgi:tRNA(Arg) A34 adenosine deaminase TadA